jgi:AraC-like DNA-binding protein
MSENIYHIESISNLQEMMGCNKPKHPLLTVINAADVSVPKEMVGTKYIADLYQIALKDKKCGFDYGRNSYDFEEGVLMFTAPGQSITLTQEMKLGEHSGWMLFFHPDLIRPFHLGKEIGSFSFFDYDVHEALHLSQDEEITLTDITEKIREEYSQRIDTHSQRVIVSSLELMLSYCLRFYERQFHTRAAKNQDVVTQFESNLKSYFEGGKHLSDGFPDIKYFAELAHLSPHYFSDLLKKDTGRSTKDHINDFIIEKAKNLLLGTQDSISEIAYDLGFNYPHYFSRLFKSKTGSTPLQYRDHN